jgi:hypothetical protein
MRGTSSRITLSLSPDSAMPLHHKGFDIIVLHAEGAPSRFRYEIQHRERALVTSPVAYASENEAVRAARVFVEGVDRLLGLDPTEREG